MKARPNVQKVFLFMWVVCLFCFLIYSGTFSQNHNSSHSLSSQVNAWFSWTVDIARSLSRP